MKRVSVWLIKNKDKAWFSLGLNFVLMLAMAILLVPIYETNDDVSMCEFIDGSCGSQDGHLVFQSVILGNLYKLLYRLPGNLPWYALFQYLVLWLSFSAVTYVLLHHMEHTRGIFMTVLILTFFAYECYIRMQFSKVAGVATGAALFLLFYAAEQERLSVLTILAGWGLGVLGAMFRFDEFLACGALMTGIGLYLLLELRNRPKGQRLRRFGRYVWIFGALLLIAFSLRIYNNYSYDSDPAWDSYDTYNDLRCQLQDYGIPDYEKYKEEYQKLEIDGDAFTLYALLNINDPDKFSAEIMEEIIQLQEPTKLDKGLIKRFWQKVPLGFFQFHIFYAVLIVLVLWIFWGSHKWSAMAAAGYELLLFGGLYFYLFYLGRYLINRVDVGFWFALVLVFTWLSAEKKICFSKKDCAVLCFCIILLNQTVWVRDYRINPNNISANLEDREQLEILGSDKEHLYILKVGTISSGSAYGPFDRIPEGQLDNLNWLGGWETQSPISLKMLETWGIENPYRDMIDNEKVYLVDNNIELTLRYLRTYYDENATAELVQQLGGLKIYSIGGSNGTTDKENK